MASPPAMYLVSLPGIFSSVTAEPKRLVTRVRADSFDAVTVSSYDTMIRPSGLVCQAVPGIRASEFSAEVMAAGDGTAGAAEAGPVASSPAAASPAAAR